MENWWLIHTNQAYGAIFSEGSPVQHFWSLAIEEQYYLFFPLLMVGLFRVFVRNLRIAAVLAFLTAASFAYAASLSSNLDRAYYNTFSRASEILVGILAAFLVAQFDRDRTDGTRHTVDAFGCRRDRSAWRGCGRPSTCTIRSCSAAARCSTASSRAS